MITWSTDKLKKEIAKGEKRKWQHLPQLQAELDRRDPDGGVQEKVLAPKLKSP